MMLRLVIAIAGVTSAIVAGARADTIRFAGAIGAPPADFEFERTGSGAPGIWALVNDNTADRGIALEQQSQDRTDYRFPVAIYKIVSAKNVAVQVRFKAMSGSVDRAGGIVVRYASPADYYVVRANALEDNVRFYGLVKGNREQLATADVKVPSNTWNVLGLRAEGTRFTVSFNGRTLYTTTDRTFEAPGKIGLWTKADSATRFDRLEINTLPP